ncbi:MAG: hypothetical protein BWX76_00259 [Candidatus Cloacimonetes bacterium ADurb.Bin089]|nr:MAG: hypothetical protein BWX76_00259 [Candidatus Cloacimonetes bacterium ADurb.Bin089]
MNSARRATEVFSKSKPENLVLGIGIIIQGVGLNILILLITISGTAIKQNVILLIKTMVCFSGNKDRNFFEFCSIIIYITAQDLAGSAEKTKRGRVNICQRKTANIRRVNSINAIPICFNPNPPVT